MSYIYHSDWQHIYVLCNPFYITRKVEINIMKVFNLLTFFSVTELYEHLSSKNKNMSTYYLKNHLMNHLSETFDCM